MNTATEQTIQDKNGELAKLLAPHRSTQVMQRVLLLSLRENGTNITKFTGDTKIPVEKRIAFIDRLIDIVSNNRWEQLPELPAGQAGAPTPAATPPPAAEPPKPVATPPPPPAPAPKPAAEPLRAIDPSEPATPPPPPPAATDAEQENDEDAGVRAVEQLLKSIKGRKGGGLTEADVRRICAEEFEKFAANALRAEVRAEIGRVFTTISAVLTEKK